MHLDATPAPAAVTLSTVTTTQTGAGLGVHDGLNAAQIEEARAALESWFWGWDFNVDVDPADGTMTASIHLTRAAWGDVIVVTIYREQDRVAVMISGRASPDGATIGDYATTTEAMAAALAWVDVWRGVTAPAGSTTENEITTGP